jgi:Flp pilus assembly protein TadB
VRADGGSALLVLAAALLLWSPAGELTRRRVHRVAGRGRRRSTGSAAPPERSGGGAPPAADVRRRRLIAAGAGLGVALLIGGPVGAVLGVVGAGGAEWALRRRRTAGDPQASLLPSLPVACDLLAVCLAAGVPPGAALAAVATAVPEPLGGQLRSVAALYRLAAEPARAWSGVPRELGPLARIFMRAGESGSAVGPALRALGAQVRAEAHSQAQARVQRAGVWVLAPLGACFLPAFLCLGVVPLVLGIAGTVFR